MIDSKDNEIRELEKLHGEGLLSRAELEQALCRLREREAPQAPCPEHDRSDRSVGRAAGRYVSLLFWAQIVSAVLIVLFFFTLKNNPPTL